MTDTTAADAPHCGELKSLVSATTYALAIRPHDVAGTPAPRLRDRRLLPIGSQVPADICTLSEVHGDQFLSRVITDFRGVETLQYSH